MRQAALVVTVVLAISGCAPDPADSQNGPWDVQTDSEAGDSPEIFDVRSDQETDTGGTECCPQGTRNALAADGVRAHGKLLHTKKDAPLSRSHRLSGCPTAVIHNPLGSEVLPQTTLHLFGDDSHSPNGDIWKWEWRATLHLLHPWAHGPDGDEASLSDDWFHELFDCYSINPHPNWGSFDPAIRDDPSLDRDDNDGAGPENISLDWPEQGMTYRVGVHYWNDHGYGRSYATVRVYLYSSLIFERPDVLLHNKDMWEVCTIHWPSGKVLPVTGENDSHQIIPDYPLPPWSPSGDRSEEP